MSANVYTLRVYSVSRRWGSGEGINWTFEANEETGAAACMIRGYGSGCGFVNEQEILDALGG